MSTLVDSQTGTIPVDGIMDDVAPVTDKEEELYGPIDFDLENFKDEIKVKSVSDSLPPKRQKVSSDGLVAVFHSLFTRN